MNIAVIGSRDFNDYEYFKSEFELFLKENNTNNYKIISGGARGADTFGKNYAKENNIEILHIDNQLTLDNYESNEDYLEKTKEGLHTLKVFSNELHGYSRLLTIAERLSQYHQRWIIKLFWKISQKHLERKLISKKPSLFAYTIYKLGYFISIF